MSWNSQRPRGGGIDEIDLTERNRGSETERNFQNERAQFNDSWTERQPPARTYGQPQQPQYGYRPPQPPGYGQQTQQQGEVGYDGQPAGGYPPQPQYPQQGQQYPQQGQQYPQQGQQYPQQGQQPFRSGPSIVQGNGAFNQGPNRPDQRATDSYNEFLQRQGIPTILPEDMAILRQCGRESLWSRSIPLTAVLCGGLMYAARQRNFNPKWYHYFGTIMLGYSIGKISYRGQCEKKLINSPSNSPFVNSIRKRRGIHVEEFTGDSGLSAVEGLSFESDYSTPAQPNQPYQQPRPDDYPQDPQQPPGAFSRSYDDLRQRNRNPPKPA